MKSTATSTWDIGSYLLNKCLAFAILPLCIIVELNVVPAALLSSILMLLQLLSVYIFRKFKPFGIFLLFAITYTLPAYLYFNRGFNITLYSADFDNYLYYKGVLVILSIFWSVFILMLPRLNDHIIIKEKLPVWDSAFFFYGILSIFCAIVIFGKSGESILSAGKYGSNEISGAGGTSLYEYGGFLYPIAYIFSGKKKSRLILLMMGAAFYCAKSLLLGVRGNTLFMLLMFFLLHLDNRKTPLLKWILMGTPALIFFIGFGIFRGGTDEGVNRIISKLVLSSEDNRIFHLVLGNQTDIYYASTRLYAFCETGILSIQDRLSSFLYNILAIVVPYSKLPEIANIAAYKQDSYYSGGGSLLPVYFYIYLSYFGVILIAVFLGLIFRLFIKKENLKYPAFTMYVVALLSAYPTWYGYSANNVYKYCVYAVIMFVIIQSIYRFYKDIQAKISLQ
jgi:hypothetical protein